MAYVVFTTVEDAEEAVKQMDLQKLNGKEVRVKFSNQKYGKEPKHDQKSEVNKQIEVKDGEETETKSKKKFPKRDREKETKKNRNGRIIVRNLSFQVSE